MILHPERQGLPEKFLIRSIIILIVLTFIIQASITAGQQEKTLSRPEALLKARENRQLSPYTGYTREHWLEITEKLISGVLPYFDPETGMPTLKGVPGETGHFSQLGQAEDRKETFERSLILVAIYTAATGRDRVPGWKGSITAPYLQGIIRGTDPKDSAYWGEREIYDAFGTNIALAALLSPRFFWDPLTPAQRENVLEFLRVLSRTTAYDCNHWYFHLMAVPLLEKNGKDSNRQFLTGIFQRLVNWYRGDGWFIDGGNFTFDYYNLWGFQLYNHSLCYFDTKWQDLFGPRVKEINARFQESFPYLYGRDGGPIPWGRSLAYRFASLSALGWAILNRANTLPPGQARRIASGCLKYFWEHGAWSENGLLEPGFYGPNSVVAEEYIRRGSPYWAAQGLICLVIPERDPFWTEVEKPMPADDTGGRMALPGAQIVLRVSAIDGEARCYVVGESVGHQGVWQRGIKYFQHAYSSYLGWCALGEGGPDLGAGRTGTSFDGKRWRFRANPRPILVEPYHCASVYDIYVDTLNPALEDFGEVITHTLIGEDGEVHIFWHNSARPVYLYAGGYGISVAPGEKLKEERQDKSLLISAAPYRSLITILDAPSGSLRAEMLEPRTGWTNSHLFGGKGAYLWWQSDEPVSPNLPVVFYVNAARGRPVVAPEISLSLDRGLLEVNFEGKKYDIRVPY